MSEKTIFFGIEIGPLIHVKRRNPVWVIFMDFCRKMDKKTEVFFVLDFSDGYGHSWTKVNKKNESA
jgi:hypothetical protein